MRESEIEKHLKSEVEKRGGITAKMTVMGRRGWPDRLVLLPDGLMAFVELKRPKVGVVSANQQNIHRKIRKLGGRIYVVASKQQVNDLMKLLCPSETAIRTTLHKILSGDPRREP